MRTHTCIKWFRSILQIGHLERVMVTLIFIGAFGLCERVRATIAASGDVTAAIPAAGGLFNNVIRVGNTGFGTLDFDQDTSLRHNANAFVGDGATGVGVVTLSDTSLWSIEQTGTDLSVGNNGTGTVILADRARLAVNDDANVGGATGSFGRVSIGGIGAAWTVGDTLTVGNSGRGIVELSGGGRLLSRASQMGIELVGNGTVDIQGVGSQWTIADTLSMGQSGTGLVHIRNGGRVFAAGNVTLGTNAGSRSDLIVDGLTSTFETGGTLSTLLGDVSLHAVGGGTITSAVAPTLGVSARLALDGGRFESRAVSAPIVNRGVIEGSGTIDAVRLDNQTQTNIRGRIYTGPGDQLELTGSLTNSALVDLLGGELQVRGLSTNNGNISARDAVVRFGTTLNSTLVAFNNTANARLAIVGGTVNIHGKVDNNPNATIYVAGDTTAIFHDDVTQSGRLISKPGSRVEILTNPNFASTSTLELELGSAEPDSAQADGHGRIDVLGRATLDGSLQVQLQDSYLPKLGDTFEILSAADGISGRFASEPAGGLPGGLRWSVQYGEKSVTLAVVPSTDINGDGAIDAADAAVIFGDWGRDGRGDLSGDDVVDAADAAILFGAWSGDSASAPPATVPEPNLPLCVGGWLLASLYLRSRSPSESQARNQSH